MSHRQILNVPGLSWRAICCCLSLLALAGCADEAAVFSGLKPEHPPPFAAGCATLTVLHPSLRWQTFSPAELKGRVGEVTYELKVWAAAHDAPGKLIYAREELREPFHDVQHPLPPSTTFFWSVRARFLLNGLPRVTDWGQQLFLSHRVREKTQGEMLGGDWIEHQYYRYYCFRTPDG
ncbi:MAG: hypothetical protein QM771_03530 [Nitrospira sp.]